MRDLMSWALPLFRAFGVQVKVHLLFFVVTLGLFLRVALMKDHPIWWVDVFAFTILLLFGIILLHEYGHCFGARYADGDAKEILIWPLGGLAYVDVPHTPRANFIATAAGPFANVLICLACAVGLIAGGNFVPSMNPFSDPYVSEMYNFQDGRDYTSVYGLKVYKPGSAEAVPTRIDERVKELKELGLTRGQVPVSAEVTASHAAAAVAQGNERALAPGWAVWLNRAFYLSWVLFLFNLIPAYPLDGGRLLQCFIWSRSDYRRGVTVAAYSGFVIAVLFMVVSIWWNESILIALSLFMLYEATMALHRLEADEGPFGYDFSAGYTSLEKDDEPPPRPKKVGWYTRWRQARRARKLQQQAEERAQEEARMDEILEKIARSGKESLTDEEKRFLERVSARKRNMS